MPQLDKKHIQPKNILNSEQKYKEYWKNPWPNTFRHVISYEPNQTYIYKWVEVLMKKLEQQSKFNKSKSLPPRFFFSITLIMK